MNKSNLLLVILLAWVMEGCVHHPHAVLVKDKGEEITCEAKEIGLIGRALANRDFDACVKEAETRGYKYKSAQ